MNKLNQLDPVQAKLAEVEQNEIIHVQRYLREADAAYAKRDYRKVIIQIIQIIILNKMLIYTQ